MIPVVNTGLTEVIPKSVVRSVNEKQTIQWPKENRQLSQNTTLEMKDEQQESHKKKMVNSGGQALPGPLVEHPSC